jgi:F-type H+-transporting ATPase subunit delta
MSSEVQKYIDDTLSLVHKKDEFDQILFDLSNVADRIGYKSVADSGDDPEKRKTLVKSVANNIGSEKLKEYFLSLLEKNELWLFEPGKFKLYCDEVENEANKIVYFRLTTAIELKNEDLAELSERLSKKMEKKIMVDLTVDRTLIGGAIIHKDNYILDFSIRSKLESLNTEWKKAIQKANSDA